MKTPRFRRRGEPASPRDAAYQPVDPSATIEPGHPPRRRRRAAILWLVLVLVVAGLLVLEAETSLVQSHLLHRVARGFTWTVEPGPAEPLELPPMGPYDRRRGYDRTWVIAESLVAHGYPVAEQARVSDGIRRAIGYGLYPIYSENVNAGLSIQDRQGRPLYQVTFPERRFAALDSIPEIVLRTLLFIENRELLETDRPHKNPAIEWDRLAKAAVEWVAGELGRGGSRPGGSTLATQIEKFRHSPDGVTRTVGDKVRQMVAASLRAYLDDRVTQEERRRILLEYVNSVPVAALPGYGEVNGLGDGLWAWYNADFRETMRLLRDENADPAGRGAAYRRVLSLFIAHRRPTHYLVANRHALEIDTDRYLRRLAAEGIISEPLRDAALRVPLDFRTAPLTRLRPSFIERKASNAIRTRLLRLTGMRQLYDLDRLDLAVRSTLDGPAEHRVTRRLQRLADPAYAESLGLRGHRLLERGDPSKIVYSFTLYETGPDGNLLRVQADNLDQPLDINEGAKLDLGSTAKLRTLVHYLEIVGEMHAAHAGLPREALRGDAAGARDPIRRWAFGWLGSAPDTTLPAMLEAALSRSYSANPAESFFTGGGLHTFVNFDDKHDGQVMSVREGFRHSVNLVFVRLMRDIVRWHTADQPAVASGILEKRDHPDRAKYLARFADKEGRIFLSRFYRKYRGQTPEEQLETLAKAVRPTPRKLAAAHRSARPEAEIGEFEAFVRSHATMAAGARTMRSLYDDLSPSKMSLQDRGYVAGIHPLELWAAAYLQQHPSATWGEVAAAGAEARQESYAWLFRPSLFEGQNTRIRGILEEDAFKEVHATWRRLGYPFQSLVPSYATAIGSSADRPAALAALIGILISDGIRREPRRLEGLRFAAGTPYETAFAAQPGQPQAVLRPGVAAAARASLLDVVENGTAQRVKGAFESRLGDPIPIGGKTGTGDNRRDIYGPRGTLIESKVVSRTATFVFFIGDRFFGTITAHVPGAEAAGYAFTSALPVQLLKGLAPDLEPLITSPPPVPPPPVPDATAAEPPAEPGPLAPGEIPDTLGTEPVPADVETEPDPGSGDAAGGDAQDTGASGDPLPIEAPPPEVPGDTAGVRSM